MFSISISRTVLVRFRILMSTISSFTCFPVASIAQEQHLVERIDCNFTQCINEQLFRYLRGRNVLEQRFPRFVPVDHKLMGGVVAHQPLERLVAETLLWQTPHARRAAVSRLASTTNLDSERATGPLRGGWASKREDGSLNQVSVVYPGAPLKQASSRKASIDSRDPGPFGRRFPFGRVGRAPRIAVRRRLR